MEERTMIGLRYRPLLQLRTSGIAVVIAMISGMVLAEAAEGASVTKASFGAIKDGTAVDLYTLTNDKGGSLKFMSYGGIITEINVPDRWRRLGNIVLGF